MSERMMTHYVGDRCISQGHAAEEKAIAERDKAIAERDERIAQAKNLIAAIVDALDKDDGDEGAVVRYLEPELRALLGETEVERD